MAEIINKNEFCTNILVKAIEVTNKTRADVFVNYAGHVNWLSVDIHEDGWSSESYNCITYTIHLDDDYEYERAERRLYNDPESKLRLSAAEAFDEIMGTLNDILEGVNK